MSNAQVWRAAQERLRRVMTPAQFETWLRGTHLRAAGDGAIELCVRTTFAKELLEARFRERIEEAIAEVSGSRQPVRIAVAPHETPPATPAQLSAGPRVAARPHESPAAMPLSSPTLFGPDLSALSALAAAPVGEARAAGDVPATARPQPAERPQPGERPQHGTPERGTPARDRGGAALPAARAISAQQRARPTEPTDSARNSLLDGQANARGAERATRSSGHGADARRDGVDGMAIMGAMGARQGHDPDDTRAGHGLPSWAAAASANGPAGIPAPRLNARYTFETFIVGSANQLAHAASLAVAEAPGQAYNPLFLYGGVGLGKTHLLHAIGHSAIATGCVVLYVSSETFTNEIINAIRYRTTEDFRAKYRSADILLVDDIQFIAGKESTEEEFFHTFNSLYETNKQIVICSDRPPKAIVSLEERLRSRFEWGLIADIQPPDHEMRVAILRAKADALRRQVPDDVLQYLAGRVQTNIRELEGSFNRLLAVSQLQGMPLNIETARTALASLETDGRHRRVSPGDVIEAVADYYRIPVEELQGKQRDKHIVVPRHVAMYLMRQETEASLLEIGQALGGRDHSTVLHGCDKIGREVNENTALRKEVSAIRQQLLG